MEWCVSNKAFGDGVIIGNKKAEIITKGDVPMVMWKEKLLPVRQLNKGQSWMNQVTVETKTTINNSGGVKKELDLHSYCIRTEGDEVTKEQT